jgi:hypothetical protein
LGRPWIRQPSERLLKETQRLFFILTLALFRLRHPRHPTDLLPTHLTGKKLRSRN